MPAEGLRALSAATGTPTPRPRPGASLRTARAREAHQLRGAGLDLSRKLRHRRSTVQGMAQCTQLPRRRGSSTPQGGLIAIGRAPPSRETAARAMTACCARLAGRPAGGEQLDLAHDRQAAQCHAGPGRPARQRRRHERDAEVRPHRGLDPVLARRLLHHLQPHAALARQPLDVDRELASRARNSARGRARPRPRGAAVEAVVVADRQHVFLGEQRRRREPPGSSWGEQSTPRSTSPWSGASVGDSRLPSRNRSSTSVRPSWLSTKPGGTWCRSIVHITPTRTTSLCARTGAAFPRARLALSKIWRKVGSIAWPSPVSCTEFLVRSKSQPPMASSRRWMALVSAGCETNERSDARVKFSVSATARK